MAHSCAVVVLARQNDRNYCVVASPQRFPRLSCSRNPRYVCALQHGLVASDINIRRANDFSTELEFVTKGFHCYGKVAQNWSHMHS